MFQVDFLRLLMTGANIDVAILHGFFHKILRLHRPLFRESAARIFQAAGEFYKNFPCRIPKFSVLYELCLPALMLHVKSFYSFDQGFHTDPLQGSYISSDIKYIRRKNVLHPYNVQKTPFLESPFENVGKFFKSVEIFSSHLVFVQPLS